MWEDKAGLKSKPRQLQMKLRSKKLLPLILRGEIRVNHLYLRKFMIKKSTMTKRRKWRIRIRTWKVEKALRMKMISQYLGEVLGSRSRLQTGTTPESTSMQRQ